MNLLPFVIIIITLFALFSTSYFEKLVMQKKETEIYLAYFKGLREARNLKEDKVYKRKKRGTKGSGSAQTSDANKKIASKYFRDEKVGWEKGRLNLSTLTENPSPLKNLAIEYVKQLYCHASFYPKDPKFASKLIDALIAEYSKVTPAFRDIKFKDETLRNAFYKMVKGTQTYSLKAKEGYPPFGDCFTFEEMGDLPIHFHYANRLLLKIVLGENGAKTLIQKELESPNEKHPHRSPFEGRSKVEEALANLGINPQIFDLFEYRYRRCSRQPKKHLDEKTNITVKVP